MAPYCLEELFPWALWLYRISCKFLEKVQLLGKCIEDKICFDFRYNFFLFLLSTREQVVS